MEERVRADFSVRASAHPARNARHAGAGETGWVASPLAKVDRFPLDRVGGEVARATSLVRYAPGSQFSSHRHDLGEEYVVLEGVFGDEHGRYPAGTYVRNPPGSEHSPDCPEGCVIFVKLRQMDEAESERLIAEPAATQALLFEDSRERVERRVLDQQQSMELADDSSRRGVEMLVLEGLVQVDDQEFAKWSWLRLPPGDSVVVRALVPSLMWVKQGAQSTGD